MRTRIVPASMLKSLEDSDWIDRSKRPFVKDGNAWIPVKEGNSYDCILKRKENYSGPGYQMVGDIALIHGKKPEKENLETLIGWKKPSCILHIEKYAGVRRIPCTTVLYGKPKEVCHKENGCKYILDPSKVMFAMGNREEKRRISGIVKKGERIADMFAGIGYFTIPAALSGSNIHAMELNSESFGYLQRNIIENKVTDKISAECGDCRDLLKGEYDRAFMGHFDSVLMIQEILSHMKCGGALHIHTINSACETIKKACKDAGFNTEISVHRVKKYAPFRWHVVQDVTLL
ncbi:MAG: SAM-dependent methyltransferase [Methanomicrobiaceae archaeon]|nr:SAM-dependent methyltransferase [Methanomicrobiaceae archaeon]